MSRPRTFGMAVSAGLALAGMVLLLAPARLAARQVAVPTAASLAPQVEELMTRFMADANVVGVTLGVGRGADVLIRGGWGYADRTAKRPATADTSYRMGSSSKQFTASLMMRLVERSLVALDDPVDRHIQVPEKWKGITVRQLLNRTSGVPDYTATGSSHWPKSLPPTGLLALVSDGSLHFTPSTKYEYSNTNYVMLALVAEKHFGKPFAQVLRDELFTPLNLTTMRYCEDKAGANGQSRGYTRDGDQINDAAYRSVTHSFGAGGICSTVADVARWNRALHTGKVVSDASYKLMTTPEGAAAGERYGFGLSVQPVAGRRAVVHNGLVPGFITVNAWLPGDNLSVTLFTNTQPTPHMPFLQRDLTRLALGLPVKIVQPIDGPGPDVSQLRRYEGTFLIKTPGTPLEIRFWVDGKVLKIQAAGQNESTLRATALEHSFGSSADWTGRFTFGVENGLATTLRFEQGGATFEGTRKK